jgi:hypothetical protein
LTGDQSFDDAISVSSADSQDSIQSIFEEHRRVVALSSLGRMAKKTSKQARGWDLLFHEEYKTNTMEVMCLKGQFVWASRFTIKSTYNDTKKFETS